MVKKLNSNFDYNISDLDKYTVRAFSLVPEVTIRTVGWVVNEASMDLVYHSEIGSAFTGIPVKEIIEGCVKNDLYQINKRHDNYSVHCLYSGEELIIIVH